MSFEQNPLSVLDAFIRRCTGHTGKGQIHCPSPATRVCTDAKGMQWYACADDEHVVASPDGAPVVHVESLESFLEGRARGRRRAETGTSAALRERRA